VFYSKRFDYAILNNKKLYTDNKTDAGAIIGSELEYLDLIFRMYSLQKAKLLICLKLLSGCTVTKEELKSYNNSCNKDNYKRLIEYSENNKKSAIDKCFQVLTDFFNHCDGTDKKKDAIRKWLSNILSEIIVLLNKDSANKVYDKQNIMGLIGFYFDKKSNCNS